MLRYILVPATGTEVDAPVFAAAVAVARAWSAHLKFLHVRADVDRIAATIAAGDPAAGGAGLVQTMSLFQRDAASRQAKAERTVREACENAQVIVGDPGALGRASAEWQVETGDQAALLAAHGRVADLLVVGRAGDGQTLAMNVLEVALLQTGRPMLIASPRPVQVDGGTVVIAWKDTREAARAVSAAVPFIQRAARAVIVSIAEDAKSTEQACTRLQQAIRWHNPKIELRQLAPGSHSLVDTLLQEVTGLE
ncbi:MAG: hypothetical protein ACREFT_09655, partial [Acetobacteraceae bacterium]